MDFAAIPTSKPGIAYNSGLRTFPPPPPTDNPSIDDLLLRASNEAASSLFSTGFSTTDPYDCKNYSDLSLPPPSKVIRDGNLVVIFESYDSLSFAYAKSGAIHCNRNGTFHHDDFIDSADVSYGSLLRSRTPVHGKVGFVHLLRPTPELWSVSLKHRTQIVDSTDAAYIVSALDIRPGMAIVESGTGSGALTHALVRAVAPMGSVHTFEFNAHRADEARREFAANGLGSVGGVRVSVTHRDVCKGGFAGGAEGGLPAGGAHAVFLDLPQPWEAVRHVPEVLRRGTGRVCSYSPCVEQVQKTCAALREHGFVDVRTVEVRLREYYVDDVAYQEMPREPPVIRRGGAAVDHAAMARLKEENLKMEAEEGEGGGSGFICGDKKEKNGDEIEGPDLAMNGGNSKPQTTKLERNVKRKLCARPFQTMKGHTAFLTFATLGLAKKILNKKKD